MPLNELLVELLQIERQIGALEADRARLLAQLESRGIRRVGAAKVLEAPRPIAPPAQLLERVAVAKQIIAVMQHIAPRPLTVAELLEQVPSDNIHSVRAAIQKLLRDGQIERVSRGRYRLVRRNPEL